MTIESQKKPPPKIKECLERLGWRNAKDRDRLWVAMVGWVKQPDNEHRQYLDNYNIDMELQSFLIEIYVPRFLTEAYQKRNPQLNITRSNGEVGTEFMKINQPLRTAFLNFTGYFRNRKKDQEKRKLTQCRSVGTGGQVPRKVPTGNTIDQTAVGAKRSANDSDEEPLMNRLRTGDTSERARVKRVRSAQTSGNSHMEEDYQPHSRQTTSQEQVRGYNFRTSSLTSTREAISASLTRFERLGITENGNAEDTLLGRKCLQPRIEHATPQRASVPLTNITGPLLRVPFTTPLATPATTPVPSTPGAPGTYRQWQRIETKAGPPTQAVLSDSSSVLPVRAKEPEFVAEFHITCLDKDSLYQGTLDTALFDFVASHLGFDNEDVSRVRITLRNPPLTLREDLKSRVFHRSDAEKIKRAVEEMSERAARKLLLSEVKREEGAVLVFVVSDVPPVVMRP